MAIKEGFSIENCLKQIQSPFELVLYAAKRTRELNAGAVPALDNHAGHKNTTRSLEEIEAFALDLTQLEQRLLREIRNKAQQQSPFQSAISKVNEKGDGKDSLLDQSDLSKDIKKAFVEDSGERANASANHELLYDRDEVKLDEGDHGVAYQEEEVAFQDVVDGPSDEAAAGKSEKDEGDNSPPEEGNS